MVGEMLRAAREARGLTLEEAERATRIRARFLAALEAEAFGQLPSEAQARGFLRNYAQYLGLDPQQVLAQYGQAAGRKRPGPGRPAPTPAPQLRGRRRLISADLLVGGLVTLVLGLLLVWGGGQFLAAGALRSTPTAPVPTTSVTTGPTPTATSPALGQAPTQPLPTPRAAYSGVNVIVQAELRIWLRVSVDGTETFAGLLPPGEIREFVGQTVVELVTGNGLGTRVIWNGQDQGTLGQLGEVVVLQWTVTGRVVPTPTITPTPTQTRPPTRTPVPSATARP